MEKTNDTLTQPAVTLRNTSVESTGSWGVVDCLCDCPCTAAMKHKIETLESELRTLKSDLKRVSVIQQQLQQREEEPNVNSSHSEPGSNTYYIPSMLYGINFTTSLPIFNVPE